MNIADIALSVIGCYFVIRGILRGISGELFLLLGTAGGFYCATRFYAPMSRLMAERLGINHLVTTGVSMLVIFLAVCLVCSAANKVIKKLLDITDLSLADKAAGAFAGFLKLYVLMLLTLVSGMIISPITGDAWVRESKMLTATALTWQVVYPALDGLGVLPDLADLQNEARAYVTKQAAGSLFRPENYSGPVMPVSADIASADLSPDAISARFEPGQLSQAPLPDLPKGRTKNQMLDFFLGWGGKNK
ncbi:MAG: CvpA family protein [Synergistaceae bacterium]|jgi:uncharacterized membrane protein required for colicin V production|nr:CvpA family protein [Synergistaceae bacterium]